MRLKSVYKNALLVLSAASAKDAATSTFVEADDPARQTFCPLEVLGADPNHDRTVYVETIDSSSNFLADDISGTPIARRGWCLQEGLLSRRMLYLTDKGLVWECTSTIENEDGSSHQVAQTIVPRDTIALYRGSAIMEFKRSRRHASNGNSVESDPLLLLNPNPWDHWRSLLIAYTSRSLTVESDTLTALAGLTEEVAPIMKCKYYAGLWEREFVRQMLWKRYTRDFFPFEFHDLPPKPASYRSPSWSRAAINGDPVEYEPISIAGFKDKSTLARVMDIKTDPASKCEYGFVNGGHVILEAKLRTNPPPEDKGALLTAGHIGYHIASKHYSFLEGSIVTPLEQGYHQQHIPHPNQKFVLIQLVRWEVKYPWNPMRPKISDK